MNEQYIVYFISKTRQNMHRFIELELKNKGLTDIIPSHGSILTVLYEHKAPLTMKEIAERIGKDKSTVTVLVNHLLKQGYIERIQNLEDKRITLIALTDLGKAIEVKYRGISKRVVDTAYEGFSDEEKVLFLKALKQMNTNFTKVVGRSENED
ncbi:MarR family winged helix-turn-helix transcriptional regulator [Fusibacter bizertensis]